MTNEQPRLTIDKRSPALWAVTFANPSINLIDAAMIGELQHLLTAAETDDRLLTCPPTTMSSCRARSTATRSAFSSTPPA